jgi:L-lactate utilization protein LutC
LSSCLTASSTSIRKRKKKQRLIRYSELKTRRFRVYRLKEEIEHYAGDKHIQKDLYLLMKDVVKATNVNIISTTEEILRKNIRHLLSQLPSHGLARRLIGTHLTKDLPRKEAASITGLSIDQIAKTRHVLNEFDLSLLKVNVFFPSLFPIT